ncbi:hypothetical protein [Arsenicibacter rosenii]|uniref:Uncharacterized protein n=1 Tax=Arsenicibacter rosenii TaxID=1750698 RepID=A0A1S2VAR6_9BACT|nr:hypothetical protein [Arsenicibacter rosenii]OIN55782.1 hypothetical protein BLX24_28235 [Arsenicibacter rosenii]
MASKTIEEIMRQASAKNQAAFKESVQQLKDNNAQLKADNYGPQTFARRAEQTRTSEPQISERVSHHLDNHQRGADKIRDAQTQSQQPKDAAPEKTTPEKTPEPER